MTSLTLKPFKPELLSPAGSLDKMKAAVLYGADAVYLAGQKYGLRSAAENFTIDELHEAVDFAGTRGVKTYVVLNSFPHDQDIADLPKFVQEISDMGVSGVIASDLGVVSIVSGESEIPIHLSTQASCLNEESGKLWKKMGVSRLILGREVSIQEAGRIKRATGLEIELFIHGSLCMAYSGNCTISNFTQGRDSNRGGCVQSCRFAYTLETKDGKKLSEQHFMSSKDLMGIDLLPYFFKEEIDSVKVEGRMRSALYTGLVSKAYREAIDTFADQGELPSKCLSQWAFELGNIPHREYMSGSLMKPADQGSVLKRDLFDEDPHFDFVGPIRKVEADRYLLVEVRSPFKEGDDIELVPFKGQAIRLKAQNLQSALGAPMTQIKANQMVRVPFIPEAQVGNFIRKQATIGKPAGAQI